jgi:predicted nucleic-acid-binding protein
MLAIDTNVLVRLLTRDDAGQTASAERFIERGAWVPTLVLADAIWVLQSVYERGPRELAKAVKMLLQHDRLVLQDADAVAAALDQFRARPSLGFSDCLILELARKAGHLPSGTFDRKLAKSSGAQKL